MTIVGNNDYQFTLSRLAYGFNGGVTMDYLQLQGHDRIMELQKHATKISEELENG